MLLYDMTIRELVEECDRTPNCTDCRFGFMFSCPVLKLSDDRELLDVEIAESK